MNKDKKIKIINCSFPDAWYKDHIGEEFKVIRTNSSPLATAYMVKEDDGMFWGVFERDCEVIS